MQLGPPKKRLIKYLKQKLSEMKVYKKVQNFTEHVIYDQPLNWIRLKKVLKTSGIKNWTLL